MRNQIYRKCCSLVEYHAKRKNIQSEPVRYMMSNMLYAYFECLCLQRKGTDSDVLFYNFEYLTNQLFYYLKKVKEDTNCFEVLKILIDGFARIGRYYRSKKMLASYDKIFEEYLKSLANDDYFVIPPEDIDREADKYRSEPKYTGKEPVKRKWRQLWLCRKKKQRT